MAQLVEAIEGMAEACAYFETPITGGNVSLYNETLGEPIFPTPVIGIVGLLPTHAPVTLPFKNAGRALLLIGGVGAADEVRFGGTQNAKQVLKAMWGLPPALDMDLEKRVQAAVRQVIAEGLAESSHDLSDGGLAVALAECSFSPGNIGARVDLDSDLREELLLFHEGPSRVLVSAANAARVVEICAAHGVAAPVIGETAVGKLTVVNRGRALIDCPVKTLQKLWEGALENLLHPVHTHVRQAS
jgi:phosphoribosylformylglycinamidine synthase